MDSIGIAIALVGALLSLASKVFSDWKQSKKANDKLQTAENEAFKVVPEAALSNLSRLLSSQEDLEKRAHEISKLIDSSYSTIQMGSLFNLYNKQIEKYQTETQSRAGWSFIFAIAAMIAGLGFVVWGASHIISGSDWRSVAAGSAISTIGGTVSAYITSTFLNVHKLSLSQLNHYFSQPVVNANILTAQRISDLMPDAKSKQASLEAILTKVVDLIHDSPESLAISSAEHQTHRNSKRPKSNNKQTGAASDAPDA